MNPYEVDSSGNSPSRANQYIGWDEVSNGIPDGPKEGLGRVRCTHPGNATIDRS